MVGFVTQNMAEVPPDMAHNAVNTQNAPAGSFGEIAKDSFNTGITPSILSYFNLLGERTGNAMRETPLPKLSPQDIEGKYGVKVDTPMEDFEAKYIADAQHNQKQYKMATENASGLKTFTADTTAFLSDPINLGSMFIPIVGQARVGAALGLDAATVAGRAATRAITFGTAGAVSQAPLSAIKFGLSQTQHTDYGIADALRDTLFAGATGIIMGPLFGGLKDAIMGSPKWADTVQRFQRMKYGDNQAVAQTGIAQMAKENPIDIEPITNISFSNDFRQKQSNMLYAAEDTESYRDKNAQIIGQEKLHEPQASDDDIIKSLSSIPKRLEDINARLKDATLPPDWRVTLENYRQKLYALADKYSDYQEMHQNEMKLAEWRGEKTPTDGGIPKPPEPIAVQQFVESQHENGVMGLGKQELTKTIAAAHTEPEIETDPHAEAEKMQAQADQLEVSLREKADAKALEEHDAWKDKQSTLDKAYQALHECLMR